MTRYFAIDRWGPEEAGYRDRGYCYEHPKQNPDVDWDNLDAILAATEAVEIFSEAILRFRYEARETYSDSARLECLARAQEYEIRLERARAELEALQ